MCAIALPAGVGVAGGRVDDGGAVLQEAGIAVVQALVVVDRSSGAAGKQCARFGVPFSAVIYPADLGIIE